MCHRYILQYIGELCRYLLSAPPAASDKGHKVRIAIGNGLRPEIWGQFQERFNVPEVGEFYGATEGNGALCNHCTVPEARGACGRGGWLMKRIMGFKIVAFDVVEEAPVRGADGFCRECPNNVAGELLMPIKQGDPSTQFVGYHNNKKANEKKIARDVFSKGDCYFRTGDLLKRDDRGYYHFVDRIGDTFRWKGENCSTNEVSEIVNTFPGVAEGNVYGVQIPNNLDGRAPMVAMSLDDGVDPADGSFYLAAFRDHCAKSLPSYALPVFLRFQPRQAVTATFKHQKVALRKQGADPTRVGGDPVYWMTGGRYERLTPAVWAGTVTAGKARL